MNNVKVGASRACITPPLGTPMAGHYYRRFTKGVIDDIYATALVFGDEKEKVVYVPEISGDITIWQDSV